MSFYSDDEPRSRQRVNHDGVEYPCEVINQVMISGALYSRIKPGEYYTKNINVEPGEEAIPLVQERDLDIPLEDELIAARDKELRENRGKQIRYECPFCGYEFKRERDCSRHFNGQVAGRETPARPVKCTIRLLKGESGASNKKPIKVFVNQ